MRPSGPRPRAARRSAGSNSALVELARLERAQQRAAPRRRRGRARARPRARVPPPRRRRANAGQMLVVRTPPKSTMRAFAAHVGAASDAEPRPAPRPAPGGDRRRRRSRPGSRRTSTASTCRCAFERISGGRSNLTYGVTDAAGHRWALRRPPLGKRLGSAHDMGREHRVISALAGHPGTGSPGRRLLRRRVRERGTVLRHGFRRRPDPALAARGDRQLRRRRAAARSASGSSTRSSRSTRSTRTRSASASSARRRTTSPAQLHRWQRPVGEVEDPRAAARRRGARPARGPDPRAGPGDDRPRRLPARQHDPQHRRRGRRGRRLGALHARRPARRRRPADGLLVGAGRRADPAVRPADHGARVPLARRASATATRSARAATSRQLDFFVALGYWKLAIVLEGVLRPLLGRPVRQGGQPDAGQQEFAKIVQRLVEGGGRGRARLG